jgi:hypothetical protein
MVKLYHKGGKRDITYVMFGVIFVEEIGYGLWKMMSSSPKEGGKLPMSFR